MATKEFSVVFEFGKRGARHGRKSSSGPQQRRLHKAGIVPDWFFNSSALHGICRALINLPRAARMQVVCQFSVPEVAALAAPSIQQETQYQLVEQGWLLGV